MRLILGIILFCWFGPYLLLNDGAIRKDFSLRSESLTLALIPTTDRKCSSTMMLFHQCSYKYEHNGETQTQNYNMFAFGAPKKLLLMKGVDSGLLTSTTGQEYLWNRLLTVTFAMFVSLMAFLGGLRLFFGSAPTPQINSGCLNNSFIKERQRRSRLNRRAREGNLVLENGPGFRAKP